jgi:hypothetical protein
MQVDPKPRLEPARQHRTRLPVEYLTAGEPAGQDRQGERAVDIACFEKDHRLGE